MTTIGGINLGNLPDYLFFFADGRNDANWQSASPGYVGDVAIDGLQADERTSGSFPYAGTIYTNAPTLGAWQQIINNNPAQSTGVTNEVARIAALETDLVSSFQQINALPVTPGFESVSATSLDGLNTQNGINEVFVINVTSGFSISSKINITGDPGDVFILRWDTDANPANGYQGTVKYQSGGAIVPQGGLTPTNFINVAGNIDSSGGGSPPPPPYPQGPRLDDGQGDLIIGGSDWTSGGFFTGYWLTTGNPTIVGPGGLLIGSTSSLSNGRFVGGWYSLTTQFSMTSGTAGVYVSPNPETLDAPAIDVEKFVSPDGGDTFESADTPPGPDIPQGTDPIFRYVVTNTGDVPLENITLTDDDLGPITIPTTTLDPGESFTVDVTGTWAEGQNVNIATATGDYEDITVTDEDPAHYVGVIEPEPSIDVEKLVSPDGGTTFFDADNPPGPNIPQGTDPVYRYIVTNTGNVPLENITLTDDDLGPITIPTTTLDPGESFTVDVTGTWAEGQNVNFATATGDFEDITVTDEDPAHYVGFIEAEPAIDVEKFVSADGGVTFDPADTPPGPNIPQGTDPVYRFVVTNLGNVGLENVMLTDDVLGAITIPQTTLAPGESFTVDVTGTWAEGENVNVATATGDFEDITVTDDDPAHYVGVVVAEPAINVEKLVSADGGTTFFDADNPPGPNIPPGTDPIFRYVVTNTGNVPLENITLTDDVLGPITIPTTTLDPGESFTVDVTGTWAEGQNVNEVTATGEYNDITVTDTDLAHYFGTAPGPNIQIQKFVSVDEGVTWNDANTPPGPLLPPGVTPYFRYVVTNTGDTPLTNIEITDNVLGLIGTIPLLNPGDEEEFIVP